jgi:UDP-N-acetylglucosamine 2-epimerase
MILCLIENNFLKFKEEQYMKVLTVIGARPQFIKAATVSNKIRKNGNSEILVY